MELFGLNRRCFSQGTQEAPGLMLRGWFNLPVTTEKYTSWGVVFLAKESNSGLIVRFSSPTSAVSLNFSFQLVCRLWSAWNFLEGEEAGGETSFILMGPNDTKVCIENERRIHHVVTSRTLFSLVTCHHLSSHLQDFTGLFSVTFCRLVFFGNISVATTYLKVTQPKGDVKKCR